MQHLTYLDSYFRDIAHHEGRYYICAEERYTWQFNLLTPGGKDFDRIFRGRDQSAHGHFVRIGGILYFVYGSPNFSRTIMVKDRVANLLRKRVFSADFNTHFLLCFAANDDHVVLVNQSGHGNSPLAPNYISLACQLFSRNLLPALCAADKWDIFLYHKRTQTFRVFALPCTMPTDNKRSRARVLTPCIADDGLTFAVATSHGHLFIFDIDE